MPMSVDKQQFNDFKDFLSVILKMDVESQESICFLKALYNIEFNLYLKNNTDTALVNDLMRYGLDLITYWYPNLQSKTENNLSCRTAYNIMSSYKYYLKGLLNDLNVYQHVTHFYIPKYVTSTGRIFSSPYFIQLQETN